MKWESKLKASETITRKATMDASKGGEKDDDNNDDERKGSISYQGGRNTYQRTKKECFLIGVGDGSRSFSLPVRILTKTSREFSPVRMATSGGNRCLICHCLISQCRPGEYCENPCIFCLTLPTRLTMESRLFPQCCSSPKGGGLTGSVIRDRRGSSRNLLPVAYIPGAVNVTAVR